MGSQRALPLCLGVCPPACLPGSGPARALCPLCLLRSDIPARDPGGQGPTGCLPGPFSGRWLGLSPRTGPRPRGLTSQQQSPLDRHPLFGALASLRTLPSPIPPCSPDRGSCAGLGATPSSRLQWGFTDGNILCIGRCRPHVATVHLERATVFLILWFMFYLRLFI